MNGGMPFSRRILLARTPAVIGGLAGAALVGCGDGESGRDDELIARLSYNTASGGGVNRKSMPGARPGDPPVDLFEVFSFDRHHAFCRVETNLAAFSMPTHALDTLVVEPHQFFMSMEVTSVEQWVVRTLEDGTASVMLRGGLDCATEVGQADTRIGGRDAKEHAAYLIDAVDGGVGGGAAGDSFAFTVFFDPDEAPVNHGIFGPEFTFTGEMIVGEITVVDPRV